MFVFKRDLRTWLAIVPLLAGLARASAASEFELTSAVLQPVFARAERPTCIVTAVTNIGPAQLVVKVTLTLPTGVQIASPRVEITNWKAGEARSLKWDVRSMQPERCQARLEVISGDQVTSWSFPVCWHEARLAEQADYVPPPEPVETGRYLVGVMMCPLWKQGTLGANWNAILPYPERQPVLGWYDEGDPEVTDWEIKWLLEHGISFGNVCWFRQKGNAGKPIEPVLGHWLHAGLFHSRYGSQFKFALMWENGNSIASGVQSEADLLENLLPFWIENYFRKPNYLVLDGKPLLYIYRPEILVRELGGEDKTRAALQKMREACVRSGFNGLAILGENHNAPAGPLRQMTAIGMDAAFSYHWPSFSGKFPAEVEPRQIAAAQEECWRDQASGNLPGIATVSMGWDSRPWGKPFSEVAWHLPLDEYKATLERAKSFMDHGPSNSLQSRVLLLDNWNEFGEGHYIFPTREFGFGYLDAIREVFATNAPPHHDLAPEDVGRGPYDSRFRAGLR